MKCKNCRGTGERHTINWKTGKVYIVQGEKCPVCGGKGDIEQTNEEWFCQLPTGEKAAVLNLKFNSANVCRLPTYNEIVKWLKEKHNG